MAKHEAPFAEARSRRALVVDDEPALVRGLARFLRAHGWETTTCTSGAAAADLLAQKSFDVVLTDLEMPGFSGIELLKLLRAQEIEVPVIVVTAASMPEGPEHILAYGAFKCLAKPVGMTELLVTLEEVASGEQPAVVPASAVRASRKHSR